jgi:hypothetical protein
MRRPSREPASPASGPARGALSARWPIADHRDPAAGTRVRCAGGAGRPRIGGLRRDDLAPGRPVHADPRPRVGRGPRRRARPAAARSRGAGGCWRCWRWPPAAWFPCRP